MACILDGTYTFVNGLHDDSSIPDIDYSNYNVIFNGQELIYLGTDTEEGFVSFAVDGTLYDFIYPSVTIYPGKGVVAFSAVETAYEGEATLSICEKESDSGACPEVPFSESAPEKYADYFNKDGVFVPKASNS